MKESSEDVEVNEKAELLYWKFKALTDRTQTEPVWSERDAFKLVVMEALRSKTTGDETQTFGTGQFLRSKK